MRRFSILFQVLYLIYCIPLNIGTLVITPRACTRSKAIGLSICCCRRRRRHENRQISSFRHYMLRIAENGLLALQIVHFLFSMPVVYRPHPSYWYVQMRLHMLELCEGKGRQIITTALQRSVAKLC